MTSLFRASLSIAALVLASPALAAPPPNFAERVEQVRKNIGLPGVSIAVVEKGQPTFVQGWGLRKASTSDRVDADTVFAVGSVSKAFTSAALAILVDRGKLKWDDPVIDHMPWFRMYDPWVTREITVRDLLVHRSGLGLGAGDLLFLPNSTLSRKDTVERLRHIKPATSFRSGYAYDNVLYMAAGQLIEEVSGKSWERFIHEEIFRPLGMTSSTATGGEFLAAPNRANPHVRGGGAGLADGPQTPLGAEALIADNAAPAGAIAVSAKDMARWLQTVAAGGRIPGSDRRLYSEEQARELWTPAVLIPVGQEPPGFEAVQAKFDNYALGWDVRDYRGAKLVWHGGAIFGSLAAVAVLPEKDVAIYVAANGSEGQLVRGLLYELLDHYLGAAPSQWPEKYDVIRTARLKAGAAQVKKDEAAVAKVGPSLPIDRYVGDYADPWYGTIQVRREGKGLHIRFPHSSGMEGPLTHYQYDSFRTNPSLAWVEPAYVTFAIGADGKVDRVTMKPVSPTADFSYDFQDLMFTPVTAPTP